MEPDPERAVVRVAVLDPERAVVRAEARLEAEPRVVEPRAEARLEVEPRVVVPLTLVPDMVRNIFTIP